MPGGTILPCKAPRLVKFSYVSIFKSRSLLYKEKCLTSNLAKLSRPTSAVALCTAVQTVRPCRDQLKCDGTRTETRFRLSAKRTSPFKSVGASVQSSTGSRGVRISGSNAGYTMFRGSVKGTGYLIHSPVSPSLSLPCVTVCHHISTAVY